MVRNWFVSRCQHCTSPSIKSRLNHSGVCHPARRGATHPAVKLWQYSKLLRDSALTMQIGFVKNKLK